MARQLGAETPCCQQQGCFEFLRCLRRLLCCSGGERPFDLVPLQKVPRLSNSFKRIVIVRHGEGRHQTDRVMTKGLGPELTQTGLIQAHGVRTNRVFADALAQSENPLFAASNVVRAVQTMWHAAPGRSIVIQPLLRERISDESDWPSRLDLLEKWLAEHHIDADLALYRRVWEKFQQADQDAGAAPAANAASAPSGELRDAAQDAYDRMVQALQEADGVGRIGGDAQESKARVSQLIEWLGTLENDTIFIASHGAFLQYVILMASQSWTGAAWAALTGAGYLQNCEVRELRLVRNLEPLGWTLLDASQELPASAGKIKPAMAPLSALDLPTGRYRLKIATAKNGQEAGWYLTARRTRASDRRSVSSTFAIVHSPVADCYKGQWLINRIRPGVYTIAFLSRDEDQASDWFLTARKSQKADKRSKDTTFAIIHEPLQESYVSHWQFLEGGGPRRYRVCLAGYQSGAFLTANRSTVSEQRSKESTYAMVLEGFEEDLVADWELELLELSTRR